MPFRNEDLFLVSRDGKDYKTKYSSLLSSLNVDLDGLDDSEVEQIVNNILNGLKPDGSADPNGIVYEPGKGNITTTGSNGVIATGNTTHNVNQIGDTSTDFALNIKNGGGIEIDSNGEIIVDPSWMTGQVNDSNINLNPGDGILIAGSPNITTNQSDPTNNLFSVDIKVGGGLDFDNHQLIVDSSVVSPNMNLDDLDDVRVPSPVDNYILTYKNNEWIAEYNPIADTPIEFKRTIDTETETAPVAGNAAGDLYVQASAGKGNVTAGNSWVGIAGETVAEGQYVLWGSDSLWHLGRTNDSLENVQSDWDETNVNELTFIQNKPDVDQLIADGISGGVGDGTLTINNADGTPAGTFSANQSTPTTIALPAGFDGDYNNLTNKPIVGTGKITINQGTKKGEFNLNDTSNTVVNLDQIFDSTITFKQDGQDDQMITTNQNGAKTITIAPSIDAYTKTESDNLFLRKDISQLVALP